MEKAREAISQAKKRRKTEVAPPETTTWPCVAKEAAQAEVGDTFTVREVAQTGVACSLAHLVAVPMNDVLLPDQRQVGSRALKYLYHLRCSCLSGG